MRTGNAFIITKPLYRVKATAVKKLIAVGSKLTPGKFQIAVHIQTERTPSAHDASVIFTGMRQPDSGFTLKALTADEAGGISEIAFLLTGGNLHIPRPAKIMGGGRNGGARGNSFLAFETYGIACVFVFHTGGGTLAYALCFLVLSLAPGTQQHNGEHHRNKQLFHNRPRLVRFSLIPP